MKETTDHRHGIKVLTESNFLEPEMGALMFSPWGLSTVGPAPATKAQIRSRVKQFTSVTLHGGVPEQLWRMFEVAKGAMVFGIFFYPLYTLGGDHLYRVFEYVVKLQYEQLRGEKLSADLRSQVRWLIDNDHFPGPAPESWMATYELRNIISHPKMQSIDTPNGASRTLHRMKNLIEHFYPPPNQNTSDVEA